MKSQQDIQIWFYSGAFFILGLFMGSFLTKFFQSKKELPQGQGSRRHAKPLISNIEQQALEIQGCSASNPCNCCKGDKVLFFSDKKDLCWEYYRNIRGERYDCRKPNCDELHKGDPEFPSSLSRIVEELNRARSSIDLCVYLITHRKLVDFIKRLAKGRIRVRIITDLTGESEDRKGDKCLDLYQAGIKIKTNRSGGLMHNKFAIIDNKKLIFGSFNWTSNAVTKNDESVLLTEHNSIVPKFRKKFESMWRDFPDYVPRD